MRAYARVLRWLADAPLCHDRCPYPLPTMLTQLTATHSDDHSARRADTPHGKLAATPATDVAAGGHHHHLRTRGTSSQDNSAAHALRSLLFKDIATAPAAAAVADEPDDADEPDALQLASRWWDAAADSAETDPLSFSAACWLLDGADVAAAAADHSDGASSSAASPRLRGEDYLLPALLSALGSSAPDGDGDEYDEVLDASDDEYDALPPPPRAAAAARAPKKKASKPKKKKRKEVSWVPKKSSGSIKKKKKRRGALADGQIAQPRGRPPHDANGIKMRWDPDSGIWRNAVTGAARMA